MGAQWYIMFMGTLKKLGYKLNPYDKCVANKTINGKQCTIAWHVDDAIASHVEQEVLNKLGVQMQADFGETDITSGTEHSFLGMNIKINEDKKTIKIEMKSPNYKVDQEI